MGSSNVQQIYLISAFCTPEVKTAIVELLLLSMCVCMCVQQNPEINAFVKTALEKKAFTIFRRKEVSKKV